MDLPSTTAITDEAIRLWFSRHQGKFIAMACRHSTPVDAPWHCIEGHCAVDDEGTTCLRLPNGVLSPCPQPGFLFGIPKVRTDTDTKSSTSGLAAFSLLALRPTEPLPINGPRWTYGLLSVIKTPSPLP
jgi:hypothetical protein